MEAMVKILLVEDDDILGYIIKDGMELIGDYEVLWCNNPKAGLEVFDTFRPDIVVSDIEMPGMTGLEMVRQIRAKNPDIPVILETGVSTGKTIIEAYDIGIDNYIRKPFLPAELDAYIKALLKRMGVVSTTNSVKESGSWVVSSSESKHVFSVFRFDAKKQTLESDTKRIELSVTESMLLELLVKNRGKLVTKDMIAEKVWGGNKFMNNQSLDVFLHNLRKYLSEDPNIRIKTVRGVGYVFEVLDA
jgi:DNA-binding response OmpR family regulator